ncbi:Oxygen-independent coproporphyrinogen-III oxidase [Salmonella bongori]|nr:Oxygen-independent coproporphyrinogen-III oxidase [Salmonella bongori]
MSLSRSFVTFVLIITAVERQWDLHFAEYFAEDLQLLSPLEKDGLVDVNETRNTSHGERTIVDS